MEATPGMTEKKPLTSRFASDRASVAVYMQMSITAA
jgi:hypothetical protein